VCNDGQLPCSLVDEKVPPSQSASGLLCAATLVEPAEIDDRIAEFGDAVLSPLYETICADRVTSWCRRPRQTGASDCQQPKVRRTRKLQVPLGAEGRVGRGHLVNARSWRRREFVGSLVASSMALIVVGRRALS
jgi:hypothetical protein